MTYRREYNLHDLSSGFGFVPGDDPDYDQDESWMENPPNTDESLWDSPDDDDDEDDEDSSLDFIDDDDDEDMECCDGCGNDDVCISTQGARLCTMCYVEGA